MSAWVIRTQLHRDIINRRVNKVNAAVYDVNVTAPLIGGGVSHLFRCEAPDFLFVLRFRVFWPNSYSSLLVENVISVVYDISIFAELASKCGDRYFIVYVLL
jgi:hypothetical protein